MVAIIMMASASSYSMVDGKAKEKVGALLTDAAKTKSLARKLFGWATFTLTIGLLAWSGWVERVLAVEEEHIKEMVNPDMLVIMQGG
ncbi:hypothetical protein CRX72_18895 [Pantoea sp. BRM17]|nr:hypothetical protein CRX72_18895 [Pantoea sp. BRM17]